MKLNEQQAKELRSMARKNFVRIWIQAIIVTTVLIYIEAVAGRWLIGLIGVKISIWQSIIAIVITNFIVGVANGLKIYAKRKKQKSK